MPKDITPNANDEARDALRLQSGSVASPVRCDPGMNCVLGLVAIAHHFAAARTISRHMLLKARDDFDFDRAPQESLPSPGRGVINASRDASSLGLRDNAIIRQVGVLRGSLAEKLWVIYTEGVAVSELRNAIMKCP